jgi:MFS family permease
MWAPDWNTVVAANLLLGVSQGLTWSTTVIMKIDLVGPRRRGLAMGLNECAGYLAVAASALATGWIAAGHGLRPQPFYLGVAYVAAGLALSVFAVRETRHFAQHEAALGHATAVSASPGQPTPGHAAAVLAPGALFRRVSVGDRNLSSACQAGLVNNLNDGMAWGLFPLVYAAGGATLAQVGALAAIYPAVWGLAQVGTGALSDRIGRKGLVVAGMWLQAAGIALTATTGSRAGFAAGAVLLGLGTAMVYPTLLAVIGDVAAPAWRASAVGVYRLWRDLGYAVGALLSGLVADAFGLGAALWLVAAITFASGLVAWLRMRETLPRPAG